MPEQTSLQSSGFRLIKWYLDGAAPDGRAFIAYWASVAWGAVSIIWQDLWTFNADGTAAHRSSLARGPEPAPSGDGGAFSWRSEALDATFRVTPRVSPCGARLLESRHGALDWRAEVPAGAIDAEIGGSAPFQANGYVECITMTVAPWHLPIRELRWGRWMDATAASSLVWIDWRGEPHQTWVWSRGQNVADGDGAVGLTDDVVTAQGNQLTLDRGRRLHHRSLADVVDRMPLLRAALPDSLLGLRQTKWLSRGELQSPGGGRTSGFAIHERVVFK